MSSKEIIFLRGATEAINLVASSVSDLKLRKDDEIILSRLEHHSNIVPWQIAAKKYGAKIKVAESDENGNVSVDSVIKEVSSKTKFICITHVSNALGTILPVKKICEEARSRGIYTLIDGCQAAPQFEIDVQDLGCDFYVFSGHKTYGPTGIGVLYGRKEILSEAPPYQGGGDMIDIVKIQNSTFADPPARFEAGTPPIIQAIALGHAIDWVVEVGIDEIGKHEKKIISYGTELIDSIDGVKVFGKAPSKTGVISFTMDCAHSHDIATIIDREGIAVRAGHHCAQPLMDAFDLVSTTRASVGAYSKYEDFDKLAAGLTKVKKIFGA